MICPVSGDKITSEDMKTRISQKHPICRNCLTDLNKRKIAIAQIEIYHPELRNKLMVKIKEIDEAKKYRRLK